MHVPCSSWGGQHPQYLLPTLVACTVLNDNTRCLLPWTCQARTPCVVKATSCRAAFQEAPARDTATGMPEPATVFAAASGRSAKRPLEDQLRPPSPADGTEAVLHMRRPVRVRSEPSNGAESRDAAPRSQAAAASAAGARPAAPARSNGQQQQSQQQREQQQQQQRQQRGGRRLTGKLAYDRDTNVMITSSSSADEVLRIVDERGLDNFNDVNLATAFHRLARVRHCMLSLKSLFAQRQGMENQLCPVSMTAATGQQFRSLHVVARTRHAVEPQASARCAVQPP